MSEEDSVSADYYDYVFLPRCPVKSAVGPVEKAPVVEAAHIIQVPVHELEECCGPVRLRLGYDDYRVVMKKWKEVYAQSGLLANGPRILGHSLQRSKRPIRREYPHQPLPVQERRPSTGNWDEDELVKLCALRRTNYIAGPRRGPMSRCC